MQVYFTESELGPIAMGLNSVFTTETSIFFVAIRLIGFILLYKHFELTFLTLKIPEK